MLAARTLSIAFVWLLLAAAVYGGSAVSCYVARWPLPAAVAVRVVLWAALAALGYGVGLVTALTLSVVVHGNYLTGFGPLNPVLLYGPVLLGPAAEVWLTRRGGPTW